MSSKKKFVTPNLPKDWSFSDLCDQDIALVCEIVDKWIAVLMNTEPLDFEKAKSAAKICYELVGKKPPNLFLRFGSPITAAYAAAILKNADRTLYKKGDGSVIDPVNLTFNQIDDELFKLAVSGIFEQLPTKEFNRVMSYCTNSACDADHHKFLALCIRCLDDQTCGSLEANWLCCDEILECSGEDKRLSAGYREIALHCGWWAAYDDCAILQDRPVAIHILNDTFHCDSGPSIEYRDGLKFYTLHGVEVPDWVANTKPEDMDPLRVLSIKNAEVRSEAVQKIGNDLLLSKFEKTLIEYEGDMYRLWSVIIPNVGVRKVLEMKNPSVDQLWHFEAVGNSCQSLRDAFISRIPESLSHLKIDDENGSDWVQQGDQYLVPKDATSIKLRPKVLT